MSWIRPSILTVPTIHHYVTVTGTIQVSRQSTVDRGRLGEWKMVLVLMFPHHDEKETNGLISGQEGHWERV